SSGAHTASSTAIDIAPALDHYDYVGIAAPLSLLRISPSPTPSKSLAETWATCFTGLETLSNPFQIFCVFHVIPKTYLSPP
ncbi:hypothetical protein HAX54_007621, partial [Datura stramonium]|nr:hypothetical protein [Datura stramonium]